MIDHVMRDIALQWSKWNGLLTEVPFWNPHGAITSLILLAAVGFLAGRYVWLTTLKR